MKKPRNRPPFTWSILPEGQIDCTATLVQILVLI
jgi:hypothetical protein